MTNRSSLTALKKELVSFLCLINSLCLDKNPRLTKVDAALIRHLTAVLHNTSKRLSKEP